MSNIDKIKCVRLRRKVPKSTLDVHTESDNPEFIRAKKEYDDFVLTDLTDMAFVNQIGTTDKMGFKWEFQVDAIIVPATSHDGQIPHVVKVNTGYDYQNPYNNPDLFGAAIDTLCNHDTKGTLVAPNIVRLTILQPLLNRTPDSVILTKRSFLERASELAKLLSTDRSVSIGEHCESCLNHCSTWINNRSETLLEFESTNLLNACIKNPRALTGDQLSKILASKPHVMTAILMAEKEVSERIGSGDTAGKCFVKQGSKLKKWADEEEVVVSKLKELGIPKTKCYTKTLVSPSRILKLLGDSNNPLRKEELEQMINISIGAEKIGTVEEQEQISLINFNQE